MKKVSCNIIRDILPLYLDDVVSDETKEMVEEHLQSCASCRGEASAMRKDVILPASKSQRFAEASVIKNIKSKIFRKKMIVCAGTVAAVLAVGVGVYALLTLPQSIIPYEKSGVSVNAVTMAGESGNTYLYFSINTSESAGSVCHDPITVQTEDGERTIAVLYAYSTPWSRYVEPRFEADKEKEDGITYELLGSADEIDEVYYGSFKPSSEFYSDPSAVLEKAELIWSKEEQKLENKG